MIYTSGIIRDITTEESLEQLQDNKLTVVCLLGFRLSIVALFVIICLQRFSPVLDIVSVSMCNYE